MKKIYRSVKNLFLSLFSFSRFESNPQELVDYIRIFNAIFVIRVFGLAVNFLTLPFRTNLPEGMYLAFEYAFYPLFFYNALLFIFRNKVYALIKKHRFLIIIDIAVSVGILFLGAGWRSSYFAYTISTIALAALFTRIRGTFFTCLILALVSFFKDPNVSGDNLFIFNATSLDMRLGASLFYVVSGVILGYFSRLLERIKKLSAEKVQAVKKQTTAEEKMRLAADLHDNIKSKITAIMLTYYPFLNSAFDKNPEMQEPLLKVWKWLHYLQNETMRLFESLKDEKINLKDDEPFDLTQLIRDECRIIGDITGFRWDFLSGNQSVLLSSSKKPVLQRFLGEALINSWKHSGVNDGTIRLEERGNTVVLSISDAGRGFNPAEQTDPTKLGLKNLSMRAGELDGELSIDAAPGRGVCISLSFPARTDYLK